MSAYGGDLNRSMPMLQEKLRRIFEKGLLTALLEIALIFFGITLALGFENWNLITVPVITVPVFAYSLI